MIKLVLNSNGTNSLIRSHNSFKDLGFVDMSMILKDNIRQGTTIRVISDNSRPQPHRGDYYLLYMQEFDSVYIFYVDIQGVLRVVYTGNVENACKGIYQNIANDTDVKILKSSGKRAYRVFRCENKRTDLEKSQLITFTYCNKSSQKINQVYLNLFDAINYASKNYRNARDKKNVSFKVITPKNTVLFTVG